MLTRTQAGTSLLIACALFLGINVIANYLFTGQRLDLTEGRLYTLSGGSRNILAQLDEPITLRLFYSAKQFTGVPQLLNHGRRVRDLLDGYAADSNGKIRLLVVDPEPFSEAEDQAVGYGIEQLPLGGAGEIGYLGLVGTNALDDEIPIPYLDPERGDALEYEITKLIYTLANPKKRVIGVISSLPVFGGTPSPASPRPTPEWGTIRLLREVFEVRQIRAEETELDEDIDTLMIIHPKELARELRYAIDQFVLKGGRAVVFIDPLAEADQPERDPGNPMAIPKVGSNLPDLMKSWGVIMDSQKIVAELESAVRVTFGGERGPMEVDYLPWMQLQGERLNQDDFITNKLNVVNVGSAGFLTAAENATTTMTPLISTGDKSGVIERDAVFFVRDPNGLLQNFAGDQSRLVIAARINGKVTTAFPDGRPLDEDEKRAPGDADFLQESVEPVNIIVVADSDILADRFWVRYENFLGMRMPNPFANNADFLINAIDNLGGNDDLISLRSRGEYARPFVVVNEIRRDAEAQFRDQERALQAKLQETETKLRELQSQRGEGNQALLSPEQRQEIERFQNEQLRTRKELRNVQHSLQKNIEGLGTKLKFLNIGLVPLLIAVFAITVSLLNARRHRQS